MVANRPSFAVPVGYQPLPTAQATGPPAATSKGWDPISAGRTLWHVPFVPLSP